MSLKTQFVKGSQISGDYDAMVAAERDATACTLNPNIDGVTRLDATPAPISVPEDGLRL